MATIFGPGGELLSAGIALPGSTPFGFPTVVLSSIGGIQLDAVLQETHRFENLVTQYPVESGATITDHIINKPLCLEMDGRLTDTPLSLVASLGAGAAGFGAQGLGEVHPSKAKGKSKELDVDINIGKIIDGFASRMDHREVPALLKEFVRQSLVRPEFSDEWYNIRFSGRYDQLLDLVGIILDHNYGPSVEILKKTMRSILGLMSSAGHPTGESIPLS